MVGDNDRIAEELETRTRGLPRGPPADGLDELTVGHLDLTSFESRVASNLGLMGRMKGYPAQAITKVAHEFGYDFTHSSERRIEVLGQMQRNSPTTLSGHQVYRSDPRSEEGREEVTYTIFAESRAGPVYADIISVSSRIRPLGGAGA